MILPLSFTGEARNMYELYQDVMAIVAKFGKPGLSMTFTCNPQWPEIDHHLFVDKGEVTKKPKNRPELICRVFKKKLDNLLSDIINRKIFGRIKA